LIDFSKRETYTLFFSDDRYGLLPKSGAILVLVKAKLSLGLTNFI